VEFFDKREEVLDLQLTRHGKKLLAQGKFKPVFYAFFDDDIIYDPAHGGAGEDTHRHQDRILTTARMKLQPNLLSSDSKELEGQEENDVERDRMLTSPLGMADFGSDKMPAWDFRFFNDNLVDVRISETGSYFAQSNIPQLDATVTFKTSIKEDGDTFKDGTSFDLEEDSLFIRILEHSVPFERENFEIQIFEREVLGGREFLKPLKNEEGNADSFDVVEYYLDVKIDNEIDIDDFCDKVPAEERTLYYVDRVFECKQRESERAQQDIYNEHDSEKIC
jgi:hypothetical protein